MQNQLAAQLVQHIATTHFTSKRALADALCVPYRVLLNVSAGNASAQNIEIVTHRILRYCIEHNITLVTAVRAFHD